MAVSMAMRSAGFLAWLCFCVVVLPSCALVQTGMRMVSVAGPFGFFAAGIGLNALLISVIVLVVAFRSRSRTQVLRLCGASFAAVSLTLGTAVFGYLYATVRIRSGLVGFSPEDNPALMVVGHSENLRTIWIGLVFSALPFLLSLIVLRRGLTLSREQVPTSSPGKRKVVAVAGVLGLFLGGYGLMYISLGQGILGTCLVYVLLVAVSTARLVSEDQHLWYVTIIAHIGIASWAVLAAIRHNRRLRKRKPDWVTWSPQ